MMDSKKVSLVALGTVSGIASTSAMATTISLTDVIAAPLFNIDQTAGTNFAGSFDIGGLVADAGLNMSNYNIASAKVSAHGYSDIDYNQSNTISDYTMYNSSSRQTRSGYWVSYYYSGSCGWGCYYSGGWSYYVSPTYATDYYYERDVREKFVDEIRDAMGLTVGSQVFSDMVSETHNSATQTATRQYARSDGSYYGGYQYYYDNVYKDESAHYGSLDIEQSLDSTNIFNMNNTGSLGFNVIANAGQFTLNSLSLTVTLERINFSQVPEPETMFLLFAGLGGILRLRNTNGRASKKMVQH